MSSSPSRVVLLVVIGLDGVILGEEAWGGELFADELRGALQEERAGTSRHEAVECAGGDKILELPPAACAAACIDGSVKVLRVVILPVLSGAAPATGDGCGSWTLSGGPDAILGSSVGCRLVDFSTQPNWVAATYELHGRPTAPAPGEEDGDLLRGCASLGS